MAFVTIQEGCDKFWTYCVVPYTRGQELSRPQEHVLDECKNLRDQGVKEVCLIGQNVNAYHGEAEARTSAGSQPSASTWGLGRLVRRLAEIDGLHRLRYTTSHPLDMDDDLIAAHGDVLALARGSGRGSGGGRAALALALLAIPALC